MHSQYTTNILPMNHQHTINYTTSILLMHYQTVNQRLRKYDIDNFILLDFYIKISAKSVSHIYANNVPIIYCFVGKQNTSLVVLLCDWMSLNSDERVVFAATTIAPANYQYTTNTLLMYRYVRKT